MSLLTPRIMHGISKVIGPVEMSEKKNAGANIINELIGWTEPLAINLPPAF